MTTAAQEHTPTLSYSLMPGPGVASVAENSQKPAKMWVQEP